MEAPCWHGDSHEPRVGDRLRPDWGFRFFLLGTRIVGRSPGLIGGRLTAEPERCRSGGRGTSSGISARGGGEGGPPSRRSVNADGPAEWGPGAVESIDAKLRFFFFLGGGLRTLKGPLRRGRCGGRGAGSATCATNGGRGIEAGTCGIWRSWTSFGALIGLKRSKMSFRKGSCRVPAWRAS